MTARFRPPRFQAPRFRVPRVVTPGERAALAASRERLLATAARCRDAALEMGEALLAREDLPDDVREEVERRQRRLKAEGFKAEGGER